MRSMGTFQLRNMDHHHEIYCIAATLDGMPDPSALRSTSAVMVAPPAPPGGRKRLWSGLMWEIKRRGVLRALRSYAGLVASLAAGALFLSAAGAAPRPDPSVLGACAIAGFPLAAALSWFFDLSPHWTRVTPTRPADTAITAPRPPGTARR